MATVPIVKVDQTPVVGERPVYQSSEGATSEVFGSGAAQGLTEGAKAISSFGNALAIAQDSIQKRNNAVARARDFGSFSEFGTTTLQSFQQTEDMADPEVVKKYNDALSEKAAEIAQKHAGGEESRAALMTRFEEQRTSLLAQASAISAKAGQDNVVFQLGKELNTATMNVFNNPGSFGSEISKWQSKLNDFRNVLPDNEWRKLEAHGVSTFAERAIESLLMRPGGVDEADRLMRATPGLTAMLNPDAQGRIVSKITMTKAELRKANQPITLSEGAKLVDPATGRVLASNPKAPTGETSIFGSSLPGRMLNIFVEGTPSFASGQMTPNQERAFLAAVQNYQEGEKDAFGNITRRTLPDYVMVALQMRGMSNLIGEGARAPSLPQTPGMPREAAATPQGGAATVAPQEGATAQGSAPTAPQEGAAAPRQPTLYEMAGDISGVPAAAKGVIGEVTGAFPDVTEAKTMAKAAQTQLVNALQNSPRYAESERKQLDKAFNILGGDIKAPATYRTELVAAYKVLKARFDYMRAQAETAPAPEDRRQAGNLARAIDETMRKITPPVVETYEDAKSLPAGTVVLVRTGRNEYRLDRIKQAQGAKGDK
jgi:hypothetical protein